MQTLKAIIVCSPDALREQLDQISGKMTLLSAAGSLATGPAGLRTLASAKASLRAIARRWLVLDAEIKLHDAHLETLTATRAARTDGGAQNRLGHCGRDAAACRRQP